MLFLPNASITPATLTKLLQKALPTLLPSQAWGASHLEGVSAPYLLQSDGTTVPRGAPGTTSAILFHVAPWVRDHA